jgi:hypothetical protein
MLRTPVSIQYISICSSNMLSIVLGVKHKLINNTTYNLQIHCYLLVIFNITQHYEHNNN